MFWLSEVRKFCASKISLTRHAARPLAASEKNETATLKPDYKIEKTA